jgi:hypothetical protein
LNTISKDVIGPNAIKGLILHANSTTLTITALLDFMKLGLGAASKKPDSFKQLFS